MVKKKVTSKEVAKNKGGRPKKMLDEARIIELASIDATVAEIASDLGCNPDTIYARYSDTLKKGREKGNISLKRKLFELAMSGNPSLLIWLSKQGRIGYRDRPIEEDQKAPQINVVIHEVAK